MQNSPLGIPQRLSSKKCIDVCVRDGIRVRVCGCIGVRVCTFRSLFLMTISP